MKNAEKKNFQKKVYEIYKKNKRDFPWRKTRNPYRILVSEFMLQQTQTGTVVKKYSKFLKKFPTVKSLARAPLGDVLLLWQGLGYNRRAVRLRNAAQMIEKEFGGRIPKDEEKLTTLPGIGKGTAGAIRAFAFNEPSVFVETNIRRVFLFEFFKRKREVKDKDIIPLVQETLDIRNPREWYGALMDYGSLLGKKEKNPNHKSAHYARQSKFKGSHREFRGEVLKSGLSLRSWDPSEIAKSLGRDRASVNKVLRELREEGFLE